MSSVADLMSGSRSPPPLVGRERELAVLSGSLKDALAGSGSLLLISGEAGIGKTTLVEWLADEARSQRACVLTGHCYDFTLTPPYGPWTDAFAGNAVGPQSELPQLLQRDPGLPPPTDQSSSFEQVRRFLASMTDRYPVVLMLEDLHWSDPASLDLLSYLAHSIDSLSCLIVATYRSDELTRKQPLFQRLPSLIRGARVQRIELQRLTEGDVKALVRGTYKLSTEDQARLVNYLHSRASGNPFYLVELLRTLESERILRPDVERYLLGNLNQAPVPALIRQVIESRLNQFSDDERDLLELAAVIGQVVPLDVWEKASEVDGDQLALTVERAMDAHVITEIPGRTSLAFTHALVQETLYYGQVLPLRVRRHRRVAEILAEIPDSPLSTVAWHFAEAGDPRAVDWLVRAGEQAISRYAAHDAVAILERAEAFAIRFSHDLLLTAYQARASAYSMIGAFDSARGDYETVLDRARADEDKTIEWQVLLDLGMLWTARDYQRTGEYYAAALALARSIDDERMVARSLNRVANWHSNLDRLDEAISQHQEALALFERLGDKEGIAETLDFLGMSTYLNSDNSTSIGYYERAIKLLRELDDRPRLTSSLATLTRIGGALTPGARSVPFVYRGVGFWERCCEEALAIARDIGAPASESYALTARSEIAGVRGDLGRALNDSEASVRIAERLGHREWVALSRRNLGQIWEELLDQRAAQAELERAVEAAKMSGSSIHLTVSANALASLLINTGNPERAAAVLDPVAQSDGNGTSLAQRYSWFVRAEFALARGDLDDALEIVEHLIETRPNPSNEDRLPYLMKFRGDVLAQLGEMDETEGSYVNAREGASLFEFRPLLWQVELALSELYQDQNRLEEAEQSSQHARAVIEDIAETLSDDKTREQFRSRALAFLPTAGSTGADSSVTTDLLSPRELEVLRLIVEGQSDREIAETLFISPRTVMRHVSNILTKLDVPSRTAAATLAIRGQVI